MGTTLFLFFFFLNMTTLKMISQLVLEKKILNKGCCWCQEVVVPEMSWLETVITNYPFIAGNSCIKSAATSMYSYTYHL